MTQQCFYCGMVVRFMDEETKRSFCTGSKYGTHKWEDVHPASDPAVMGR